MNYLVTIFISQRLFNLHRIDSLYFIEVVGIVIAQSGCYGFSLFIKTLDRSTYLEISPDL